MTRDDIIRMAREAGFDPDTPIKGTGEILAWEGHDCVEVSESLKRFAALVAAHEREACAKVCEKQIKSYMSKQYTTDPLGGFRERFAAEQCAAAIRARGET